MGVPSEKIERGIGNIEDELIYIEDTVEQQPQYLSEESFIKLIAISTRISNIFQARIKRR